MKKVMIKKDLDHSKLETLGYKYNIMEAGYISEDTATVVCIDRSPYQRQVMQFRPNAIIEHEANIERLRNIGAIEDPDENVSFDEAIKAYTDGHEIHCYLDDEVNSYSPTDKYGDDKEIAIKEILRGRWRIEYRY